METVLCPLIGVILSVVLLYFISAMEVATFSIAGISAEEYSGRKRWLLESANNPGNMEAFFIVAKAFFLGAFAVFLHIYIDNTILFDILVIRYIIEGMLLGGIAIMTFTVLPAQAVIWDEVTTLRFSSLLVMLYVVFFPLKEIARIVLDFILRNLKLEGLASLATQRQLAYIADESGTRLEDEELQMIRHIVEFVEKNTREVMVPRIDMICAPIDSTKENIIELIRNHGHSRIPLYRDTIDNIVGILYSKDLLIETGNSNNEIELSKICRKPFFVPESKLIDELLEEFRKERLHIAIVVDEYGGVAGIVTMEDLLEEIIGEIQDEYDTEEEPIQELSENAWRVLGKIAIDEVEKLVNVELPQDDADTIGGLIYQVAGAIPEPGYKVEIADDLVFIVEQIEGQRIISVKIIKKSK